MNTQPQTVAYASPNLDPHIDVNMIGKASPGPLPALRRLLLDLREGEVLLLRTDFPAMRGDLEAWSRQTNHFVLHTAVEKGLQAFHILKGDPWPVDVSIDAATSRCPTPVLAAKQHLVGLKPGQLVKLTTNCSSAPVEVSTWIRCTPYTMVCMLADIYGHYRFYLAR